MKALYLDNPTSGKKLSAKKRVYIVHELLRIFPDLDIKESQNKEDFISICKNACGVYDTLIFSGGDGSFNMVVNAIADKENRPVLGIIPTGTINDGAKNFGISKNVKKAIRVIENNKIKAFDIGKLNDNYFVYCAAIGAYADIPYITKKEYKEKYGALAYYHVAIKELFKIRKLEGNLCFDKEKIHFKTPFFLVLNSRRIGGFTINPASKNDDGVMDVFTTKPGLFNSLLNYMIFRFALKHYSLSEFKVDFDAPDYWDLDGEMYPGGPATITCLKQHIKIYAKK